MKNRIDMGKQRGVENKENELGDSMSLHGVSTDDHDWGIQRYREEQAFLQYLSVIKRNLGNDQKKAEVTLSPDLSHALVGEKYLFRKNQDGKREQTEFPLEEGEKICTIRTYEFPKEFCSYYAVDIKNSQGIPSTKYRNGWGNIRVAKNEMNKLVEQVHELNLNDDNNGAEDNPQYQSSIEYDEEKQQLNIRNDKRVIYTIDSVKKGENNMTYECLQTGRTIYIIQGDANDGFIEIIECNKPETGKKDTSFGKENGETITYCICKKNGKKIQAPGKHLLTCGHYIQAYDLHSREPDVLYDANGDVLGRTVYHGGVYYGGVGWGNSNISVVCNERDGKTVYSLINEYGENCGDIDCFSDGKRDRSKFVVRVYGKNQHPIKRSFIIVKNTRGNYMRIDI